MLYFFSLTVETEAAGFWPGRTGGTGANNTWNIHKYNIFWFGLLTHTVAIGDVRWQFWHRHSHSRNRVVGIVSGAPRRIIMGPVSFSTVVESENRVRQARWKSYNIGVGDVAVCMTTASRRYGYNLTFICSIREKIRTFLGECCAHCWLSYTQMHSVSTMATPTVIAPVIICRPGWWQQFAISSFGDGEWTSAHWLNTSRFI